VADHVAGLDELDGGYPLQVRKAAVVLSYVGLGVNRALTPRLVLLGIAAGMNSIAFGSVFPLALLSLLRVFTLPAESGEPVTAG
jgi:hypothetical protein